MIEDESIEEYFLRVDEVKNMIRELGEEVKEEMIVQKILRSLPMWFNGKVSAIEEMVNLKDLKMDQLHGTLTTYDMKVEGKSINLRKRNSKYPKRPRNTKITNTSPAMNLIGS